MSEAKKITGFHRKSMYVDLGLPSGLLWATCNVGATSPEQAGLYFAWGETQGGLVNMNTKLSPNLFSEIAYDADGVCCPYEILSPCCDAAHVKIGGNWRIPSEADFKELLLNTTRRWIRGSKNKSYGVEFTSKFNGGTVFFPEVGYIEGNELLFADKMGCYWSACKNNNQAGILKIMSDNSSWGYMPRYYGLPVRAVLEF